MLTLIYLVAISAEAMSGALAAGRRNMDLFGVSLIAFVAALGGGTVRDILLGNYPVTWTQHPEYIYLTISAGLLTLLVARFIHHLYRLFLLVDALGLVAFTIIGCNVALSLGYSTVVVIMSAVITGIFGGILRDILCHRTPQVLRRELYACVSLVVALVYLGLNAWQVAEAITLSLAFAVGISLRLAALRWGWSLPVFSYPAGRWGH